jgi:predicted MFS family arabinose efflux permease
MPPASIVSSLVLIEMGQTFNLPVGVMGQIQTGSSITAVIVGLLMGALSLRFPHKQLLIMGLGMLSLAALGSGLAPTFLSLLIMYSLTGVMQATVGPMANTLIGTHYPPEERPIALSWTVVGMMVSWIIGAHLVSWITEMSGWRTAFLSYVLPVS